MMENEWTGTFLFMTSMLSVTGTAALAVWLVKIHKKLRYSLKLIENLRKDFNVICATATRASSRVVHLEKQLRKLGDRHEQLELRDPMNHSYGQAIAMAKKGMGADELVNILGIPRGEAELIALMHNVKKAS